jgi:curved DNA-binding protein
MEFKDYYQVLEIDKNTGADDIEKAYRKLARRYHPDINPDDETAKKRFAEINEAHRVLTQAEARAKYDRMVASWEAHQTAGTEAPFDWAPWHANQEQDVFTKMDSPVEGSPDGFFEAIFGEMNLDQSQDLSTPRKGQDYHQNVEISLEDAFTGSARLLRLGGRRLEVKIPKGARTGTKVRVRNEGGEGIAGGARGDLYLEITVAPHPVFQWLGDDLHLELPVNLYSAILGGEAIVPTLKGKIKLRIPPETQSGRVFRLKAQGMPKLKNPEERGDLYAKVMVTLPENLTETEIELFEELADLRGL